MKRAERFEKLFELPNNLYSQGSPVILAAGALLKDTQTSNVIVQLKFHSVSETPIKALKVGIAAFDVTGKEIEGVEEYQYLDLKIQNGEEFGSNKAVVLPNMVARSFKVSTASVVLSDDSVRAVTMPLEPLKKAETLQSFLHDTEIVKQYQIEVNEKAKYVPQEDMGLWMCACGVWNSTKGCTQCSLDKENIFFKLSRQELEEKAAYRVECEKKEEMQQQQLAVEQEAKQKEEQTLQRKKIKQAYRILAIVGVLAFTVLLLYFAWIKPFIIQPHIKYMNALQYVEEKKYEDAYTLFKELGTYKESELYLENFKWVLLEEKASWFQRCFFYDEQGRLALVNRYTNYGEWEFYRKDVYTYNENGKLVKCDYYDEKEKLTFTYNYIYDENEFLIRELYDYHDGRREVNHDFVNDERGNAIKETYEDDDGNQYTIITAYSEDDLILQKEYVKADRKGKVVNQQVRTFEYNNYGDKVLDTAVTDGITNIYTKFDYNYDEYGMKTICNETRQDGTHYTYQYEYKLLYLPVE